MKIESIYIRNYRSLRCVDLLSCSSVNALIGKNNAGKSNIFSAIDIAYNHFKTGSITSDWPLRGRYADDFSDRDVTKHIQIGIELAAAPELVENIKSIIAANIEGMDVPLAAIESSSSISVIVSGRHTGGKISRYIEAICFGPLQATQMKVAIAGTRIFQISDNLSSEIITVDRTISELQASIKGIDRAISEISPSMREMPANLREDRDYRRYMASRALENTLLSRDVANAIQTASQEASDPSDFEKRILPNKATLQSRIVELQNRNASEPMHAFSGLVRTIPPYVSDILSELAKINLLHFKEDKPAIGSEEALQLLKLKTTRGGPAQLSAFQSVVQQLLGVAVDAFSPEAELLPRRARSAERGAEMDVDDFLVEANGAGIREALRIILDIEMKKPEIVLVEEPEVHLHPGLERALHSYLSEKGRSRQIFIATHSTSFLDVSSRQNVYSALRASSETKVTQAASEEDILRIPGEIGLRPSTLFMYDKLAFVEGPTDEDVIRAFARTLSYDASLKNVGFVKMGGASNIANYSTEATLSLFSKRAISMVFVIDRDERNREEIEKIQNRLGSKAFFKVLSRRELENYLLSPSSILSLLNEKRQTSADKFRELPTEEQLAKDISDASLSLKGRTRDILIAKDVLKPIYVNRSKGETPKDKIVSAIEVLQSRLTTFDADVSKIDLLLENDWNDQSQKRAPGEEILDAVFKKYGFSYKKEQDAFRLAERIPQSQIDVEIISLIQEIVRV